MVAHTGFLMICRRLAPNTLPQERSTRPAKAAEGLQGAWDEEEEWSESRVGLRLSSDKKIRKVRRDLQAKASTWVEGRESDEL